MRYTLVDQQGGTATQRISFFMQHFHFPTDFDSIKTLVDDANKLAEDNARLKRLVNGKLKGAPKPPTKPTSKPDSKSDGKSGLKLSLSNGWADAPSVSEVASKSTGKKKRPVESEVEISDSDDDTPLPKKTKTDKSDKTDKTDKKDKKDKKKKAFKGVTAYNVFFGVRTTSMRKESPEIDRGEVARLTGTAWKALTPDEKAPWGVKAAERNVIKRAEFDAKKAKEGANEDTDEDDE